MPNADGSRGIRTFRAACAAMKLDHRTLEHDTLTLNGWEEFALHELWRALAIADATAAGEWPVTVDAEARRKQRVRDQRYRLNQRAPGRQHQEAA